MKKRSTVHGKRTLVVSIVVAIILMLASQPALAENNGIYLKVFNGTAINGDPIKTVTCNSYDDHELLYETGEPAPGATITQNDMILSVSVLCPKYEMHLDPVVHIDGNEWDWWEFTDVEDGYLDFIKAEVSCIENEDGVYGETFAPARVVLECLDHESIIVKKNDKL